MTTADQNDNYSFFEYDDLGRVVLTRDNYLNILSKTEYNISSLAMFNIIETGNYQHDEKIDAGDNLSIIANSEGSKGTYTLTITPENKYTTTTPMSNETGVFSGIQLTDPGVDYTIKMKFDKDGLSSSYKRIIEVY